MLITISGTPGSGKSTVAKLLVEKLHAQRIYAGQIMRDMAQQRGLTLEQFTSYAQKHPEVDLEVDQRVAQEVRSQKQSQHTLIVEGRTQSYFFPHSFKIFITVDPHEGARRIWQDLQNKTISKERNEGKITSLKALEKSIGQREEKDAQRYKAIYNFDYRDRAHYDLILDSTNRTPEQIVKEIKNAVKLALKLKRSKK